MCSMLGKKKVDCEAAALLASRRSHVNSDCPMKSEWKKLMFVIPGQ